MNFIVTLLVLLVSSNFLSGQCLEAYYPFTGDATDHSGYGRHAIVNGATLTTDRFGNPNSAYEFDGIDDFIDTHFSFDFQERTVSVWAMVYDTASERKVLDQDDIALNHGAFSVTFKNGNLYGNAGGEGGNLIHPGPELNQWYHVVMVRDSLSTMIYVNGDLVHAGTPTSNGSLTVPNPNLVIGAWRNRAARFFSGKIDDIQIFNCALNSSLVYELYTSIEEHIDVNTNLYPNPMTNFAILEFENPDRKPYSLSLIDQGGMVVRRINNIRDNSVRIEKDNLAAGLYFFQLQTSGQTAASGKILME